MSGTFLDMSFSDEENVSEQLNLSDLVFPGNSGNDSDTNGGLSDIETREDPTFVSNPFYSAPEKPTNQPMNISQTQTQELIPYQPKNPILEAILTAAGPAGGQAPPKTDGDSGEKSAKNNRKRKSTPPKKKRNESKFHFKKTAAANRSGLSGLSQMFRDAERKGKKLNCIPKLPFQKLVREIAYEMKENLRFQREALDALLEASEAMLIRIFEDANMCTLHAGRVTLFPSDMKLALKIASPAVLQ